MKSYQNYKPTGIKWLGDIPKHWEVQRFATLGSFLKGGGISRSDLQPEGVGAILYGDIYTKYEFKVTQIVNRISLDTASKSIKLETGNLLMTGSGETKEDIGKCIAFLSDEECFAGGDVLIFDQKDNDSMFLSYALSSNGAIYQKASDAKGEIVVHIYATQLRNHLIALPPISEQKAIAEFLDRKTEEIDKLIANKQKLIEFLKEERTAIINRAVTKGINRDVKLKRSGIDWLGEIPEHWEIKRLKYLVSKVGSGVTPLGGATVYQTEGIPLIRSQNIYSDGLLLDDVAYITEEIDESMSNSRIEEGDVLLNITGASLGRCFYVPKGFGKGNVNQHVCILRPHASLMDFGFLHSILVSGYGQNLIERCQVGANREGLNFQQIRNFSLPYCEIHEQVKIVEFIDGKSQAINRTISKVETEIELMREYRTALISEVVTGKVKVA